MATGYENREDGGGRDRKVSRRKVLGRRGTATGFRRSDGPGDAVGGLLDGMAARVERENRERREREREEGSE